MTTENIDIVVREDGSRVVRRNLEDIGTGARSGAAGVDRLQDSLKELKTLLAGLGIGYGINEVIRYADEWANLQGRLGLVTDSFAQMKTVQEQLFAVAQKTRVEYASTSDVFSRISRATKDMNTTDADRLRVVETINKALIVSGASSEEAHRALIQLGQGLGAGILRGQDLNSVLEQTPRLAQAIAEGMGKSVGEIKKMGEEGTLTSNAVFQSLLSQGKTLDAEFSRMPQTIGQSFVLLKNEVLKFVGQTAEANNMAGNFASVLAFVANNINVIAAALQGLLVYKVAQFFLDSAASLVRKYTALIDTTNALNAERAATIAAAEATVANTAAEAAMAAAQVASIETSRALYVARLQEANSNIASARAAIAAAEAAGAQSFAMRVLRDSTAQLAIAEGERAAAMGALAVLGQQQARASAAATAATAAEAAATTALAGARSAATAGAGLAARALGLLGGSIGIITTVLSLGATAWALWGSSARTSEQQAQQAVEESHESVMDRLDKQIKKLKERNDLISSNPDLVQQNSNPAAMAAQEDMARILGKIRDVSKDANLTDLQRTEILRVLGAQYGEATQKLAEFNKEQNNNTALTNADKVKQWLDKHSEYLSKTEQLAHAIGEAKKELGAAFTPEIEKRITDSLGKKDGEHDALLAYKEKIEALKMQQKLQQEISNGELAHAQAVYGQGGMSQTSFFKAEEQARLDENTRMTEFVQKQLELTKGAGKEQVAARAQYTGELAVLAQQRKNIEQKYSDDVAGIFAKRKQDEIAAGFQELASLNQQNQALENKIKYFQMLPDAITAATVAELEAQKATLEGSGFFDPEKLDLLIAKIAALKQLAGNQKVSQQQEYDWNQAQQIAQQWKQTGDIIANSLTTAFGKGGSALAKMVQGYTGFKSAEADLKKQMDDRVKVASGNAERIHAAEVEYDNATVKAKFDMYAQMAGGAKDFFGQQTAAYKILQAVEQAYHLASMAMAYEDMIRKVLFSETVTATKVAGTVTETAANVASVGPNVAADGAKATASGIAAVAKTLASLPFPLNWAAGAAVLGLLVSLGVKMSGGGSAGSLSLSAQRQQDQGTGTVLGDATKKSDSIAKALGHMSSNSDMALTHSSAMMHSLQNIETSISGLGSLLVRGSGLTGNIAGTSLGTAGSIGKTLGSVLTLGLSSGGWLGNAFASIFGGKTTTLDTGLTATASSVANILANGVQANQYTDTKTSGGWFSSDKYNTSTTSLGGEANDQFTKVIQNMVSSISAAGGALGITGDDFTSHLNNFVVDIGKVSLKGLTGDQIQQQLEAVFSKLGDDMAKYAMPGLDQFQKVGEGYFETLVRVAAGVDSANYELEKLGVTAVNYTDIVNKQGDVETEIIRQSLIAQETGNGVVQMLQNFSGSAADLISNFQALVKVQQLFNNVGLDSNNLSASSIRGAGGLSQLSDGAQTFFDNFFSDAEKHAAQLADLTIQFSKLGLSVPQSKDDFKELVLSLDDGSDASNALIGKLLSLSGAVNDLYGSANTASQKRQMEIKIVELSGDKVRSLAMTREDELAAMDQSLQGLQKQIYALEDLQTAHDNLQSAYDAESSQLTTLRDKYLTLGKDLRDLINQIQLGSDSNLSPEGKYAAAKAQFDSVYTKALSGDQGALADLKQSAQDFLTASKDYNATGPQYGADYDKVMVALSNAANVADTQANIAQEQLNQMQSMVSGILNLNGTTQKFYDAYMAYMNAQKTATDVGAPVPGASAPVDPNAAGIAAINQQVSDYGKQYGGDAYYFIPGINDYDGKLQAAHMVNQALGDKFGPAMTDDERLGYMYGHDAAYWKQVSDEFYAGGHPVARALGGFTNPGMTLVGEYGPELVNFDRPGMVYNTSQSSVMMGNAQEQMASIAKAIEDMKAALLVELQAANQQRGTASVVSIERLEALEAAMEDMRRTMERA